jgi:hypothetical protein
MDSNLKLFADPTDRWPALLVAMVLTVLLFAAIDAGFTTHVAGLGTQVGAP